MQFVGPLSVGGESDPADDLLTFEDGMFKSRICRTYGFEPAPYWVRRDEEGLHFQTKLQSAEHGTIRFEGIFDGADMRARALWTKERWYWTVEQKMDFVGRPRE